MPPKNLDELRHLYIQIRNGEHAMRLTDRALSILKRMLDEPSETAAKSISEIALENDINISSITRLAQKLGFKGFPEFKELFRDNLKQRRTFYSEQVKKFLQKGDLPENGNTSLLEQVIHDEWGNSMLTLDAFDKTKFDNIVNLIATAGNVLVIGLRGSYPLAHFFGFYLKMIRDNVTIIGQAGHTMAEDLSVLKSGDLLVAISLKPYTKDTTDACRVVRNMDIDVAVLTDSLSSPLAIETENYLITSTAGDCFYTPIVGAALYMETLLSQLVKVLGDKAIQRLNDTEDLLGKLEIEI